MYIWPNSLFGAPPFRSVIHFPLCFAAFESSPTLVPGAENPFCIVICSFCEFSDPICAASTCVSHRLAGESCVGAPGATFFDCTTGPHLVCLLC